MESAAFVRAVAAFAGGCGMLRTGELVLAAVSGGTDSMCLLHVLRRLSGEMGFALAAAHFDHGLRGADSAADAQFVADYCDSVGIPCRIGHGRLPAGSGEDAARNQRYAFLEKTAAELGAGAIATGHNADDNAETVLLHMVRGAGLRGLCGIPPVRGKLIRPLLSVSRAEIAAYCKENRILHREDETNSQDIYTRNRIRQGVIPLLREENPRFSEAVMTMTTLLRVDEQYLSGQASAFLERHFQDGRLDARALAALPRAISSRVIRQILGEGLSMVHTAAVLQLAEGDDPSAQADLPGVTVRREYDDLLFGPPPPEGSFNPVTLSPGTAEELVGTGLRVYCENDRYPEKIHKYFNTFWFKRTMVCGKLTVRPRITGDVIDLTGAGTKTLKKLFIEKKIPAARRGLIPVLADDLGPLAVYGLGAGSRARPAPGDTVLKIRFEEI